MVKLYAGVVAFAVVVLLNTPAGAQTALEPGDIVFSGYSSTGTDAFSFVLLRAVAAGTTVAFTDRGWLAAGGFRAGEGAFELTLGSDYPCGSEFHAVLSPLEVRDDSGGIAGTTTGAGLQLSTSGDQVFAFQGALPVAGDEHGLLAVIHMNGGWDADAPSTNASTRPAGLLDGVHALALVPEINNARYDCSLAGAEPPHLVAAIQDASNWLVDDVVPFDLSLPCGVECAGACEAPTVPTIGGDQEIFAGETAWVSIEDGELGDASDWHWYVDGCGITSVGMGETLALSPSTTVEVFVRGEGGCVTPESCASRVIEVEPPPPSPQSHSQRTCLNVMFRQLGIASGIQSDEVAKCAKGHSKGKVPSAEACVNGDVTGKVAKAAARISERFGKKCREMPDFGLAGDVELASAAVEGGRGLWTDVLGGALDGTIVPGEDIPGSKCQLGVMASAKKCFAARLKEYAKCVKAGLKDGSIVGVAGMSACLSADPRGKVAMACDFGFSGDKKVDEVRKSLMKLCLSTDVLPGRVLPSCASAADVEAAHACLSSRVACRACRTVDHAGAIGAPCDLLDDGLQNQSCPG